MIVDIVRQKRDRRGDPVGPELKLPVEILFGGPAPELMNGRRETASSEGQIGVWVDQPNKIVKGDRLLIQGDYYVVVGEPLWAEDHSFSGTTTLSEVYWVKIEGTI